MQFLNAGKCNGSVKLSVSHCTSGRGKFMPLSPKTTQIQNVISRVKEELERHCFRHLTQHRQGFLMIKYQLLKKIYSFSTAGPQSLLKLLT